jgi:hypothetical protein
MVDLKQSKLKNKAGNQETGSPHWLDHSVRPHVKLMALWSKKEIQDVKKGTNKTEKAVDSLKGAKDERVGECWLDSTS